MKDIIKSALYFLFLLTGFILSCENNEWPEIEDKVNFSRTEENLNNINKNKVLRFSSGDGIRIFQ